MSKPECPCYGCDKRHVGCHGDCDAYKAWSAWNEAERDRLHKQAEMANIGRHKWSKKK